MELVGGEQANMQLLSAIPFSTHCFMNVPDVFLISEKMTSCCEQDLGYVEKPHPGKQAIRQVGRRKHTGTNPPATTPFQPGASIPGDGSKINQNPCTLRTEHWVNDYLGKQARTDAN